VKTVPPWFALQAVVMAMIWWKWLLVVLGVLIALIWLRTKAYRRSIRKNLILYLQEAHPELEIISEHSHHLIVRSEKLEPSQMNLHNLFSQVILARATPDQQRAIFKTFVSALMENMARASRPMSLAEDGDFLLPRLLNAADLASMLRNGKLIHRPLEGTGLSVVYVRDSEQAVNYLLEDSLGELQMDAAVLHERALANLRKKSPPGFARAAVDDSKVSVFKFGDTFDAARALLIPEQLREGETVAVVISDRDTLGIMPPPPDGDWASLARLARAVDGPPLLNRPLKVTSRGFELVGGRA